ncbi:hypothetical protein C2W63_02434 [Bacillus velezensis]|nr:hypothetical protein C2W63_02434 [Bacillus velezensis]
MPSDPFYQLDPVFTMNRNGFQVFYTFIIQLLMDILYFLYL